jgi:glycosyltransferase involved in cell wall biosynthesis
MELSVIIPTYNRQKMLIKCINALSNQTYPFDKYEIVVVNDGSTDHTKQEINDLSCSIKVKVKYLEQEHKGTAAAKNLGVKNSSGKIIFITGDDIVVTPNLLQEHMNQHRMFPQNNIAILGHVTWPPEINITPFMKWLESGGPQFAYYLIKNGTADFWFFYSSNISVKKEFLIENGLFDEEFPHAAYEDTELGYRLKNKGLMIKYDKNAIGYHYHQGINLENYKKRMVKAGESAAILCRKHPELKPGIESAPGKILKKKKPGWFYAFIYEKLYKFNLTQLVKGLQWRAKRYYSQELAQAFLKGYSGREKIL